MEGRGAHRWLRCCTSGGVFRSVGAVKAGTYLHGLDAGRGESHCSVSDPTRSLGVGGELVDVGKLLSFLSLLPNAGT